MQYRRVQYVIVQYSTVICSVVQYNIVQYRIVQYILLQCSTVQYRTGTTAATAQMVTEMYQQLSMLALLPNDVITGSTGRRRHCCHCSIQAGGGSLQRDVVLCALLY